MKIKMATADSTKPDPTEPSAAAAAAPVPALLPAVSTASTTPLSGSPISAYLDFSGSMQANIDSFPATRIHALMEFARSFDLAQLVLWSDSLESHFTRPTGISMISRKQPGYRDLVGYRINTIECIPSRGTRPSMCAAIPVRHNVLLFATDGEIEEREVNAFSNEFKHDASLVLCVLVGNSDVPLTRLNLSVVSPFLSSPHLVLYLTATECRVISGSAGLGPNLPLTLPLKEFPLFDRNNYQVSAPIPVPAGYLRIGDYFVQQSCANLTMAELQIIDVPALIVRLKTLGEFQGLRMRLNELKRGYEVRAADPLAVDGDLMAAIIAASDPAERAALRSRLLAARSAAAVTTNRAETKQIQAWLALMAGVQAADYSASSITTLLAGKVSNRFLYANDSSCHSEWDYSGAFVAECPICAEDGVLGLLVLANGRAVDCSNSEWRGSEDVTTMFLTDFAINFPLAVRANIFSAMPLCVDCAAARMAVKLDVYRVPIIGFLPAVDRSKAGHRYHHELNQIFAHGRTAVHLSLVVLALLQVAKMQGWSTNEPMPELLDFMIEQTLVNTNSRVGLIEGGNWEPTQKVLQQLTTNEMTASRQPLYAYSCIVATLSRREIASPMAFVYLGRTFIRYVVELWRRQLTVDPSLKNRQLRFYQNDFFNTPHGIPCASRQRMLTLTNSQIMAGLQQDLAYILHLFKQMKVTISDNFLTVLLSTLTRLKHDNSVDHLLAELKEMREFRELWADVNMLRDGYINTGTNPLSLLPEDLRVVDERHRRPPPFLTPFAASRLTCCCGEQFFCHEKLMEHLEFVYRSRHPCSRSGHYPLHLSIRTILASRSDTVVTRGIVIEVLALLRARNLGNIYQPDLIANVVAVTASYFRARLLFPEFSGDETMSGEQLVELERRNRRRCDYSLDYPPDDDPLLTPFTTAEQKIFDDFVTYYESSSR